METGRGQCALVRTNPGMRVSRRPLHEPPTRLALLLWTRSAPGKGDDDEREACRNETRIPGLPPGVGGGGPGRGDELPEHWGRGSGAGPEPQLTIQHPMKAGFNRVKYAPDGKTLAASTSAEVTLWDAESGQQSATLQAERVADLEFSPDGKTLASGGFSTPLMLWDVPTKSLRSTLRRNGQHSLPGLRRRRQDPGDRPGRWHRPDLGHRLGKAAAHVPGSRRYG